MGERSARTLGALREAAPSLSLIGDPATPISGIACSLELGDVRPGVLFAPLDQPTPQAAAFAARAVAKGAAALLVEKRLGLAAPQLIAPDSRAALAHLAAAFNGYPARELRCIGVTGTDGKTTTTFLIDAILRAAGFATGLIGSMVFRVGGEERYHQTLQTTPESPYLQRLLRRMADAGTEWAILESTSEGLARHRLDEIPFAIGAITFVTQAHLEFHGSVAAYRRAKAILFEQVAAHGGTAVINADDPGAREMHAYVGAAQVMTYSATGRPAAVRATDVESGAQGQRFTLTTPAGTAAGALPFLGRFNVANAVCAATVAHAAGVPLAEIARGLTEAAPVPGLLTRVEAGQPFAVLVDEAKTIGQLAIAIEVARQLAGGRRVIVLVGAAQRAGRETLMRKGQVAELAADFAVFTTQWAVTGDLDTLPEHLAAGAASVGGHRGKTFTCVTDRREAIRHALGLAEPGDVVLLAGKGAENTLTILSTVHPWNEAAIARELLLELGYGADRPAFTAT
jgi:UDP-N-acetylmuramoyl-L-alanyl-D-glutamate--2,6-diaminopimelate ligase